jgi:hypothetical protein
MKGYLYALLIVAAVILLYRSMFCCRLVALSNSGDLRYKEDPVNVKRIAAEDRLEILAIKDEDGLMLVMVAEKVGGANELVFIFDGSGNIIGYY